MSLIGVKDQPMQLGWFERGWLAPGYALTIVPEDAPHRFYRRIITQLTYGGDSSPAEAPMSYLQDDQEYLEGLNDEPKIIGLIDYMTGKALSETLNKMLLGAVILEKATDTRIAQISERMLEEWQGSADC